MTPASPSHARDVAARLTQLTLDECAAAIGVTGLSPVLQRTATFPFLPFARRLGAEIGQFDADTAVSLQHGARALLTRLHVPVRAEFVEPLPNQGPLLIIANHPGVYDAVLLFASVARPDLRLIAAERSFLRSLSNLSRHLVFVPDAPTPNATSGGEPLQATGSEARAAKATRPTAAKSTTDLALSGRGRGLREVVRHLKGGGAVLHFAAGQIEPDPAFFNRENCLGAWSGSAAALANTCQRLGGHVVLALVSGVHSPRVKHSALIRYAEARGVTTLSALLQIALPRIFTVSPVVRFSAPLFRSATAELSSNQLREVLRGLHSGIGSAQ